MSKVNWFYEIGQEIKNDKIDAIIIDKEVRPTKVKDNRKNDSYFVQNYKYYRLKCNKCGYDEWWIVEYNLKKIKSGCPCCANQIAVLGINTIWDKAPWMIDLGVSEEYAKKYTHSSGQKIWVTCPDCGDKKHITISKIYDRHSISCNCGDGISYPEKFIIALLKQLNINFKSQLDKDIFNWCDKYRYDFYFKLNTKKYIIEAHGIQHYRERASWSKTLENQQENDKTKKQLALNNSIDGYIEIDCSKSELEFIKSNILNSELNNLFDLSKIDWNKCEEYALKNIVKEVCDYWYLHNDINNEGLTVIDLSNYFSLSTTSIRRYLHQGTKLGWCNYNTELGVKKPVCMYKDNILLGIFEGGKKISYSSETMFGCKLFGANISAVCNDKLEQYKGFTFRYATKEEYEQAVKNNTINKRIDNKKLEQVS